VVFLNEAIKLKICTKCTFNKKDIAYITLLIRHKSTSLANSIQYIHSLHMIITISCCDLQEHVNYECKLRYTVRAVSLRVNQLEFICISAVCRHMQDSTCSMRQVRMQNLANVPISTEPRQF
jgi:hypothetical protein